MYSLLQDHPATSLYPDKEVSFYNNHWARGVDWYEACFPAPGTRIDTSPKYFMAGARVAPRIAKLVGDQQPKFVLVLRNPIDYVYAHYRFHLSRGYFEANPDLYPTIYDSIIDHVQAYPDYTNRGKYYHILTETWLQHFALNQFYVILFEDFIQQPETVGRDILAFFDLPDNPLTPSHTAQNKLLRYPFLYAIKRFVAQHTWLKTWLQRNDLFKSVYKRFLTQKTQSLTAAERTHLQTLFEDDVQHLKNLLQNDLAAWGDFRQGQSLKQ